MNHHSENDHSKFDADGHIEAYLEKHKDSLGKLDPDGQIEAFLQKFKKSVENRKHRTELNEEVIRTTPDDDLVNAVYDVIDFRIGHDFEHDVEKVPPLGAGFSAVYFLTLLEAEVNNGAFNQMFYNNGREAVVLAKQGADYLGLKSLASIIGEALALEEAQREKMTAVREVGTLETFMDSYQDIDFEDVSDRFIEQGKDIEKVMIAFIRNNSNMFCGKGGG